MKKIRTIERECKALGQQRRLQILTFIKKKRRASVGDLTEALGTTLQGTSQHLRVLREAGILLNHKRGREVMYMLAREQSAIVRAILGML